MSYCHEWTQESQPAADLDVPACLARVRRGDDRAAEALLEHLYPLVCKVVRAHLPRRCGEEDLIQMVFMKVFTKLEQFSGAVPLEHWVARIAVNTCRNQLASERVRPELRWADLTEEEEAVVHALAASEAALPAGEQLAARDLVERLFESLKPSDRWLMTMMYLEGKSLAEIHQATHWNISLIKVRAFRARRKLRKQLAGLLAAEGV